MQTHGQSGKNKGHGQEQKTGLEEFSLELVHRLIILFDESGGLQR